MIASFDKMVRWWLKPLPVSSIAAVRFGLGLMTVLYFIDALTDAGFWFGVDAVHSSSKVASFLHQSGLQDAAAVSISPLFLTDSLWVYQSYCFVGIAMATVMMLGRGGRPVCVAVWLAVVFWANRLLWLAGLTETILCLSLFATCLAPTWKLPLWRREEPNKDPQSGSASSTGLALRLLAVQGTLIAAATWMSMLAGDVWWNGTGAIALAAPETTRSFALVERLRSPWAHEPVTLAMMVAVPLGVWLAWKDAGGQRYRSWGIGILVAWAILIAILGSHWLYAGTLICTFAAITKLSSV